MLKFKEVDNSFNLFKNSLET